MNARGSLFIDTQTRGSTSKDARGRSCTEDCVSAFMNATCKEDRISACMDVSSGSMVFQGSTWDLKEARACIFILKIKACT